MTVAILVRDTSTSEVYLRPTNFIPVTFFVAKI